MPTILNHHHFLLALSQRQSSRPHQLPDLLMRWVTECLLSFWCIRMHIRLHIRLHIGRFGMAIYDAWKSMGFIALGIIGVYWATFLASWDNLGEWC